MKRLQIFDGRVAVLGLAGCLLFAGSASASLIGVAVSVQSVTANAGDSGDTFELAVTNDSGSALTLASFNFGFSISDTDITLLDATDATAVNSYVFQGNSEFGPDILVSTDGQSLEASDLYADFGSGVTLNPGDTFGLGLVSFNVAADAVPGIYGITLNPGQDATSFTDENFNTVAIDALNDGQITVDASAVPEPGTLGLFGAALFAVAFFARMRGRARTARAF